MSLSASIIDAMIAAGCTAEQLGAAIKADISERTARESDRLAKGAERTRRSRERNGLSRDVTLQPVTERDIVTPPPLSRPPNENISNPPTHTPPDIYIPRAKADPFPKLDCASDELWRDLLTNRKRKNLSNTATAHRKLQTDLTAMAARTGWPPGEVLEACVAKGWGAIYDPRDDENGRTKPNRGGGKPNGIARALDRQLGLGEFAGEVGRPPTFDGEPDRGSPIAIATTVR